MKDCIDKYGQPCDCSMPGAMRRDGVTVTVPLAMMDGATGNRRGTEQARLEQAYRDHETLITNAWRREPPQRAATHTHDDTGDYMAAHNEKVANAWKRGNTR